MCTHSTRSITKSMLFATSGSTLDRGKLFSTSRFIMKPGIILYNCSTHTTTHVCKQSDSHRCTRGMHECSSYAIWIMECMECIFPVTMFYKHGDDRCKMYLLHFDPSKISQWINGTHKNTDNERAYLEKSLTHMTTRLVVWVMVYSRSVNSSVRTSALNLFCYRIRNTSESNVCSWNVSHPCNHSLSALAIAVSCIHLSINGLIVCRIAYLRVWQMFEGVCVNKWIR